MHSNGRPRLTEPAISHRAWLITFTDLVSLMLTFFVMLFATSSVKVDSWGSAVDSLTQALRSSLGVASGSGSTLFGIETATRKRAVDLDYLAVVLNRSAGADPLLNRLQIARETDRLIVALPGDWLFEPGRAALSDQGRALLARLGELLGNIGNQIGVNGHTDPLPVRSGEYPSNWELSLVRAAAVAEALQRSGYGGGVVAFGFADSRFHRLPLLEEDQRRALARRVDIVVLPFVRDN